MNQKIIKNLINFGLLETEAKVYCSALALDDATIDKIAKQAGINRTSCYAVMDRLKELGLVSQTKLKGKAIFKSVQPEKFYDILDDKKENITKIIPELKSLFEINRGRPDVRFYDGREGLKTVLSSILQETKEVLIFGDGDSFIKAIPGWTEAYVNKRSNKDIKIKIILKASPDAVKSIKKVRESSEQVRKLVKVRVLPEAYKIEYSGFDVYNNKVVFYSFAKQNNAVVIDSRLISTMMKTVFNILWETAEKYDNLLN